jgi:hypothetical protein
MDYLEREYGELLRQTPDYGFGPIRTGLDLGSHTALIFRDAQGERFGWMVFVIQSTGAIREMVIAAARLAEIKYESQVAESVIRLATDAGCSRIRVLTVRRGLARRLRRHGFTKTETIELVKELQGGNGNAHRRQ